MDVMEYLNKVAHQEEMNFGNSTSQVWKSNFDNSYITLVGLEQNVKFLADREITQDLAHGVGFSPKDNKWYGWSHRAIYGFTIGSTCKKGDCHYKPLNLGDACEDALRFWADEEYHSKTWVENVKDGVVEICWIYNDKVPNLNLRGTAGGTKSQYNPDDFGRGEWVAVTMEDAKQMAIDFSSGVS